MSRILVIDDEAALGENIERMLRSPGVTVSVCVDPVKGLAECLANPPDLVLLDVRMPGMSGVELYKQLVQSLQAIPTIFITAHADAEMKTWVSKPGVIALLYKPFQPEVLLQAVRKAIAR